MSISTRSKWLAAAAVGLRPNDIYLLKSVKHRGWLARTYLPGRRVIPVAPFSFSTPAPVTQAEISLAERLIAAYHLSVAASDVRAGVSPMWARNLTEKQASLKSALEAGNPHGLAELLATMFCRPIMYGIDSGDLYRGSNWRVHSLKLLDDLVSLAEQLGVARAESGQGPIGHAFDNGLPALVLKIEDALGCRIGFPEVGGAYGLRVDGKLITLATPEYACVAWRVARALDLHHSSARDAADLLEIGAGYGGTAIYLFRLIQNRIRRYTIVDLPVINCLQGYFLASVLGSDAVALHGETWMRDAFVHVVPPQAIDECGPVDIVINQNSMPEINAEAAHGYIQWIANNVRGFFYSYNHESLVTGGRFAVLTVPELVADTGGLRRVSRNCSWIRPGYVEEIYVPSGQTI
jgi:hypothetical protein